MEKLSMKRPKIISGRIGFWRLKTGHMVRFAGVDDEHFGDICYSDFPISIQFARHQKNQKL